MNELNNFAAFAYSQYFGVVLIGGVYERGASNTILTAYVEGACIR